MLSLPSRERGLKSPSAAPSAALLTSLPSRERGLKFIPKPLIPDQVIVAPLTGAWIEISYDTSVKRITEVAPLTGAWIEIMVNSAAGLLGRSRSPHGSVD